MGGTASKIRDVANAFDSKDSVNDPNAKDDDDEAFEHSDAVSAASETLRAELQAQGKTNSDAVVVYLQRVFHSFERAPKLHKQRLHLAPEITDILSAEGSVSLRAGMAEPSVSVKPGAAEPPKPPETNDRDAKKLKGFSLQEKAQVIANKWKQRHEAELEDSMLAVLISPADPDDFIALGRRRLYW